MMQKKLLAILIKTSTWLPSSNARRAVMLVLFLIGIRACTNHNGVYVIYWGLVAVLSPRIMGTVKYLFERLGGLFKKNNSD